MTNHRTISLQEWSALFDAAIAFKELRCWEWMYESDLFGVQDPNTGEVGYCCVLGNLGEVLALNVYFGAEGLESYWSPHEVDEAERDDPLRAYAVLNSQKCLMASFEDRSTLHKTDLRLIRELGLQFRGKKAWPMFRNYLPGYYPWFLVSPEEIRFLTLTLQQAKEVALKMTENPDFLIPPTEDEDLYLVRVWQDGQRRSITQQARVSVGLGWLSLAYYSAKEVTKRFTGSIKPGFAHADLAGMLHRRERDYEHRIFSNR